MTREELLAQVRLRMARGEITRADVLATLAVAPLPQGTTTAGRRFAVSNVLYCVGGLVVFLGIIILVFQNWEFLPSIVRIFVTLGVAIAALIAGTLLGTNEKLRTVSAVFYLLSAVLAPLGFSVTLNEVGISWWAAGWQTVQAGVLAAAFLVARLALRQYLFTFFTIVFGTWFYYALIAWLLTNLGSRTAELVYEYATLLLGIAYVLLGSALTRTRERFYTDLLYLAGLLTFFGAAFALSGFSAGEHPLWETLLPLLALGAVFASIPLKSRIFLFVGGLALAADVVKLTSVYFAGTLGWPLVLVVAGLGLIVVGYVTFALNQRYLKV